MKKELAVIWGTSVWLEWLRTMFINVHDESDPTWIECAAKAYLLFLLDCTLFVDKFSMQVSIMYMKLPKNLWEVRDYT